MAIWQDLVTDYQFEGAYNTVKRFVGKLRGSRQPEQVILTAPGEDWTKPPAGGRGTEAPEIAAKIPAH
jgi:hypothetical protein